jgi:hypothetical protein
MKGTPLILLAPSEEKTPGGWPGVLPETEAQAWVRKQLVALAKLGAAENLQKAFGVKGLALDRARTEALALAGAKAGRPLPLLPALDRYSGVAFQSLDAGTLRPECWPQVLILSNLRGLVRGNEQVPAYKLNLAAIPGLKAHWQRALAGPLGGLPEGPIWDLLPGEHASLLRGWDRARHRVEILDDQGRAISHFAKKYRGLVARWLLEHQEGDPAKVLKGRIPGCQWVGVTEHPQGGLLLRLKVER